MSAKHKPGGGKRPIPLKQVAAGDAFLGPLEDGRRFVCRVLQVAPDGRSVLVGASTWVGTEPPDTADPQLRKLLRLNHHAWGGHIEMHWISDPVPASFTRLGVIPPTAKEATLPCSSYGSWESFALQVHMQWRWNHERAQVLAEDAAKERAAQEAREQARRAYVPLPPQTLEDLRRETPFADWAGYVEPAALRGSRRLIRELIDALIALGPDVTEATVLDEIDHCVEQFNDLDQDDQLFIETMEREDICGLLERIGDLLGLDDYGEEPFGSRDW